MTTRIFDQYRVWKLDRKTLEEAVSIMSDIVRNQWTPEVVVGIARGGVEPARLLADHLRLPVYYVRAKHNSSDSIRSTPLSRVYVDSADVAKVPCESRVLLIDDICGSGKTLASVSRHLRKLRGITTLNTATLCCNAGSQLAPDLSIWKVRDWVVFPWEIVPSETTTESLQLRCCSGSFVPQVLEELVAHSMDGQAV